MYTVKWIQTAHILRLVVKFEDLSKPELKEHYLQNKSKWFPKDDTKANAKFDKSLDYSKKNIASIISLCPKLFFVEGAASEENIYKFSSKGIQKDKMISLKKDSKKY